MTNAKLFDAGLKYGATAIFMATIWIAFQAGLSATSMIMQGASSVIFAMTITFGLIGTEMIRPELDKRAFFTILPAASLINFLISHAIQA